MTERQQQILRGLMKLLERMDQCAEEVLFHALGQIVQKLLMSELQWGCRYAEGQGWLIGVTSIFGSPKWSLSDKGRAAVAEMQ
ncbi:MAG: hypothetical protein JWM16_4186 [Verrucomicrobiales bacterium]|nr:hypothetical protein [Verrucomicrobiales bacterium]